MAEWTITLKNTTGDPLLIQDLGWSMPDGSNANILNEFTFDALVNSSSLKTAVSSGDVVVNDGSTDLSVADGTDFLRRAHKKYVDDQISTLNTSLSGDISTVQGELDNG